MQCEAERLAVTGSDSSSDLLEVMKINGLPELSFPESDAARTRWKSNAESNSKFWLVYPVRGIS